MRTEVMIEKLKNMVRTTAMNSELEVNLEDNLKDDIGLDSMSIVELVVAIESEFEIKISENELSSAVVFNDVVKMVTEKMTAGV